VTAPIQVAIHDDNEIFRRGLRSSLQSDAGLAIAHVADPTASHGEIDVAVVSAPIAGLHAFPCPLVICVPERSSSIELAQGNIAAGVLRRGSLTSRQLHAAVRAAAAGLRVEGSRETGEDAGADLSARSVRVLELLATGLGTREIATHLSYSERTIKKQIHEVELHLGARSRPHAVAEALRRGIIA
jgi:DNA-binding NarL/FixJ family response regulator